MNGAVGVRARQFLQALGLASLAALSLAVVMPTIIYLGNSDEFTAPWFVLVTQYLPLAGVVIVGCAILAAAVSPSIFRRGMVLAATLCILTWVQGNLLVWHYGLFDGRAIDWSRDSWRGWLDLTIWISGLLLADAFRDRLGVIVVRIAVALCVLQTLALAASLGATGITSKPSGAPKSEDVVATLAEFSGDTNILHIFADGFQADSFQDMLDQVGSGDRIAGRLDGFVYFHDHMGAFPYTHMSVPAMLSGQIYTNQEPQAKFMARALGPQSILTAASAAGYDVQLGVPEGTLTTIYGFATKARLLAIPAQRNGNAWRTGRDEALLLADLTLFRLVPHFVKRLVYNDQSWCLQLLFGRSSVAGGAVFAHNAVLHELAAGMSTSHRRPTYKLVHLMLSHSPMVMNSACGYAGHILPTNRSNVRIQAGCGLQSILAVLDRMKQLGIYDKATIVITGDHGAWISPNSLSHDRNAYRQALEKGIALNYVGHARPLLLVKPPRSHGALRISTAPSWIADIPATIADAAGIPGKFPGVSALRLDDAAPRPRTFHVYDYSRRDWSAEYLADIQEFVVLGRVDEISSWTRGRIFRAPTAAQAEPAVPAEPEP